MFMSVSKITLFSLIKFETKIMHPLLYCGYIDVFEVKTLQKRFIWRTNFIQRKFSYVSIKNFRNDFSLHFDCDRFTTNRPNISDYSFLQFHFGIRKCFKWQCDISLPHFNMIVRMMELFMFSESLIPIHQYSRIVD